MIGLHFIQSLKDFKIDYELTNCMQVFTNSFKHMPEGKKKLYVHSPYSLVPWQSTPAQLGFFTSELKKCAKHNAVGYVLHLPCMRPEDIHSAVCTLTKIAVKFKIKVLLEMPSLKPSEGSYETPEKLNALVSIISTCEHKFYICIDTAHLWGMGQDIRTYDGARKWLSALDKPDRIGLIHLNGTSVELGGNRDVHQVPFSEQDIMWHGISYTDSGARAFIEFAEYYKIDCIMEINRGDVADLHKFYSMINYKHDQQTKANKISRTKRK